MKVLKDNMGGYLGDLGFGNDFYRYNDKSMIHERKIVELDFIKIKSSSLWKTLAAKWKVNSQVGRKKLYKTYML